jgi:exonuclease SbcD
MIGTMRILHTSDWHLGRQFHGVSLDDDHDAVLDQVRAALDLYHPQMLIIAGDIFDRASPPQSALTRLGGFLRCVSEIRDLVIVIIAGNHDSAAQIGMLSVLASGTRTLVRGPLDRDERPLVVDHSDGPVAISALPFAYEFAARACFDEEGISCPADVIAAQLARARRHVPSGARWVVVAHAFVDGAASSDSERPLSRTVGGIETVPAAVFDGAHYVALGHLHRPQAVGAPHIRYSGAPLAFGFDEEDQEKSLTLADLAADGSVTVTPLPIVPRRSLRTIRGKLLELLALPPGSQDFIKIVLTDDSPQIDPMKRIREVFPNAVQLSYERDRPRTYLSSGAAPQALDTPQQIVANFVDFVRGEALSSAEDTLVEEQLAALAQQGDDA